MPEAWTNSEKPAGMEVLDGFLCGEGELLHESIGRHGFRGPMASFASGGLVCCAMLCCWDWHFERHLMNHGLPCICSSYFGEDFLGLAHC